MTSDRQATGWGRRYPPMLVILAALTLAMFTLPSALNLPIANPGQTLEYAPLPGDGSASAGGNIAGLGLGETSNQNLALDSLLPPAPDLGLGSSPSSKRCVGSPPRQTEDVMAPPCVASFRGDNGGATYTGVTGSQVTVVFIIDPYHEDDCSPPQQDPPANRYVDIAAPPDPSVESAQCYTRVLRNWQHYFNDRYQTYGRFVHFWAYFTSTTESPDQRRAEAADIWSKLHPFATLIVNAANGYINTYRDAMLQHGTMFFTTYLFISSKVFQQFAPLLWDYSPSLEEQARSFVAYICKKVAPYQVHFSGNGDSGQPRVYGLVTTTDARKPSLQTFQNLIASQATAQCGMQFKDKAQYPNDGDVFYSGPNSQQYTTYAEPSMATFKKDGITTIIWPGGYEDQYSKAAGSLNYRPEWVVAGDGCCGDGYFDQDQQDQAVWSHAFVVTPVARLDAQEPPDCLQAYGTVDPNAPGTLTMNDLLYACELYPSLRQLFTGIQVSGPKLLPPNVDRGYHAIPPYQSNSPYLPACYYDPGDYTCVKDMEAMWYDPAGVNSMGTSGCYRMVESGLRHTAEGWPAGNVDAQKTAGDPCNGFRGNWTGNVNPP